MNINNYEFSGVGIIGAEDNGEAVNIFIMGASRDNTITKEDVIALAQHFNVTEIDLIS